MSVKLRHSYFRRIITDYPQTRKNYLSSIKYMNKFFYYLSKLYKDIDKIGKPRLSLSARFELEELLLERLSNILSNTSK